MRRRLRKRRPSRVKQNTDIKTLARILRRTLISAPEMITFFPEHADDTILLARSIKDVCDTKQRVLLEFSKTSLITAAGMAYLYSEMDQLLDQHGQQAVIISTSSVSLMVRYILKQSGLLLLVNQQPEPTGSMLPIISGEDDAHLQDIIQYLISQAVLHKQLGEVGTVEAEKLAGEAIKEAMLNVKYHAYPNLQKSHGGSQHQYMTVNFILPCVTGAWGFPKLYQEALGLKVFGVFRR